MTTYTTDHKWKSFKYRGEMPQSVQDEYPHTYGDLFLKYLGVWYSLSEFTRVPHPDLYDDDIPITPHGVTGGSAFHSVFIELSEDGDSYKICLAKS